MWYYVVTEGRYIACLRRIAAGAGPDLSSLCSAGRSFGLRPIAVAVTEGVGVAVNIAVAACAGMCGITLLGAGRCCHYCIVVMPCCGYLFVSCVVAAGAGIVCLPAYFGASCCFCFVMYGVMTKSIHIPCLGRIAAGAGSGLDSFCGASGCSRYRPLAKIVTECIGITIYIAVTTVCAGVGGVTLFRAGGLGDNCIVIMASCGYLFISRVVTTRAGIVCFPAYFGASCRFCFVVDAVMAEGINIIVDVAVAAVGASVGRVALDRASRGKHFCYVVVAGRRYLFVGGVITNGASVVSFPALFRASRCLAVMVYESVSECVNNSRFAYITAAAISYFLTFFGAGGLGRYRPCAVVMTKGFYLRHTAIDHTAAGALHACRVSGFGAGCRFLADFDHRVTEKRRKIILILVSANGALVQRVAALEAGRLYDGHNIVVRQKLVVSGFGF